MNFAEFLSIFSITLLSNQFDYFISDKFFQLATLRPRRPDTHRPTSDTFKPAKHPATSPVQISPVAHEEIRADADDEAPPPLPEKAMHSDYANVDPTSGSRNSLESDERPHLTRRVTHRDRVSYVIYCLRLLQYCHCICCILMA